MKILDRIFGSGWFYVISSDPMIVISYENDLLKNFQKVREYFPKDKKVYFLIQSGWNQETRERVLDLKDKFGKAITEDRFKPVFLANSLKAESLLLEHGFTAHFCHQNAFLDESRYKVLKTARKDYDAIYIARITPFKRHLLAKKIKSLLLIGDHSPHEEDYFRSVMPELSHAVWKKSVASANISKYINQAGVGLCLSEEEGAMYVSAEYLLSGVPVVNTPNMGGRDAFLSEDNSIVSEDNEAAVKDSVAALIRRNIDPDLIREKTIQRFQVHRNKFKSIVQDIYDKESVKKIFNDEWDKVFIHKFGLRLSRLDTFFLKLGFR